jgi:hydrogenase-4 component D
LLIFIGAMSGLVLSSTLLGQLLFFEITGGCPALISYYQSEKSQRSAMKALLITHVGSLGLYLAAAAVSVNRHLRAERLKPVKRQRCLNRLRWDFVCRLGKSAQLPLQAWLPDAMEAPTPVSAYLHAASMVKVGVYIFARAISEGGQIPEVIGWSASPWRPSPVYGFLMYLPQKDMKRLLAWSTISQLAWIFALSMSIFGSKMAFNAGIVYIFNHAFAKSLFFLVAGHSAIAAVRVCCRVFVA